MKKVLLSLLLLLLLIFSSSCSLLEAPPETEGDLAGVLETLDGLRSVGYSSVSLSILATSGNFAASAEYVLTAFGVSYSIERPAKLPSLDEFEGDQIPYLERISGTAEIKDGETTRIVGSDVEIPSYTELAASFIFSYENLTNVTLGEGSLSADVLSPSVFYGYDVEISDLHFDLTYTDAALASLSLTYRVGQTVVSASYTFIK